MDPNKQARMAEKAARAAEDARSIEGLTFEEWPKIARLNRDVIITEKLDGTNAAVGIKFERIDLGDGLTQLRTRVWAQSRTRIITPSQDNQGFARWVRKHADVLISTLGEGLHFGEWWGVGIQRGYDLSERRFSLFNTKRWNTGEGALALSVARAQGVAIYSVPVLWEGPWMMPVGTVVGYIDDGAPFNEDGSPKFIDLPSVPARRYMPEFELEFLRNSGSRAVPGYMKPEGIVVFHQASGICFKATVEGDEQHKFEMPSAFDPNAGTAL